MTKKVIIIDDSLTSLNLIKTAFADAGWEVYGTQHAHRALEMIYDIAPDIIITDALMPVMGGFQFLKLLRSNPSTEKIPVIIYSVLDDKNSKFYVKNERAEYYLKKSENISELTDLANAVTIRHPVSDEYKFNILKTNIEFNNIVEQPKEEKIRIDYPVFQEEALEREFKEKYDFSRSDDKIFSDIFSLLYDLLDYNLAIISVHSFEKNEKIVYFDIRNIILSPVFQNNILHEMKTKNSFLFKKYAPNLKVVTNEEEFFTKISYDFEHADKNVASIIFYAKEKARWTNIENMEKLKNMLANFFRAHYINKSSQINRSNDVTSKYFMDKLDFKFDSIKNREMYIAIIEINNYRELEDKLSSEELDFLNLKISEKLINFVSDDEQIIKNDEDEYSMVFFAKDKNHALQKLGWVLDLINETEIEEEDKADVTIGCANCKINEQFNYYEAQKQARIALDKANSQNRIVIYDK